MAAGRGAGGERTVAVVLFTDLVGSTELRARLGEETAEELRRTHDRLLTQIVEANSGRVVKGLGDGIMATFAGASDAVAAAVTIQQAIDRHNRSAKSPAAVEVRIGISAGDVTTEDDDVHGTPVIEAARLCAAAGGDDILVSEVVRLLAGLADDDLAGRGRLDLKGLHKPVAAWEVRWEPAARSTLPMPALLTDMGRIFVGRDAELERLAQLWKEAAAGERRVAFVAGEPGVGKTRLAAELGTRVHEDGAIVLAGRCDEDLGVPYQPFVEALRHFVDHTPPVDLREGLGRHRGELARLVPDLPERLPGLPIPLRSDPETERYRLFDAVAAWLSAVSASGPLLVVLDDLQWAAKPTLLLLRHVVRSAEVKRLVVLGTYRDTELGHGHPLADVVADLRREGGVERISLLGLDPSGVSAYMEEAAGHALDDDDLGLARAVYEETEGNPFFVREVFRHLTETGAIGRHGGRWTTRLPLDELGIPESVRDVVGRRLSRLTEDANRALRIAAVVGAEFDLSVVQAAGGLDQETVLSSLEEATEARLVIEATALDRYRFAHALVRDALYGELSSSRRAALHHRVAEAIEMLHGDALDDQLPALAHHWARADTPGAHTAKAIDYATRAGNRALVQLAHDEAVGYYRQALELREATGAPPDAPHSELMISLGEAQRRAGDPAHRATLLEAGRIAQQVGDAGLIARAALVNRRGLFSRVGTVDEQRVAALQAALEALGPADSPTRARLLAALASELHFAGDQRRVHLGREGLAMARRLGEPSTLAEALEAVWLAVRDPVAIAERAVIAAEFADVAGQIGDPLLEFHAGFVGFLTGSEQGDVAAADRGLATCIRIAEELGQPVLRWRAAYLQAHRAAMHGRFDDMERWADEALRLGEAAGQPDTAAFSDLFYVRMMQGRADDAVELARPLAQQFGNAEVHPAGLAWACAEAGRVDEARAVVARLRGQRFGALRRHYLWSGTLVLLSRACIRLGDTQAVQELYDLLRPLHSTIVIGQSVWVGPVAYDLGLLATTLGRYADADAHFAAAVETHNRIGVPGILAHVCLEWVRMLLARRQQGDAERARDLLGRARDTAREVGLPNIERRAVALLEECA
jgi:class 3 adenylate cyclase/tetratricopeptide (TPR) repeat protein